jgi:DNA replication protein DnaC
MSYNKIAYDNAERELKRRADASEDEAKARFEKACELSPELVNVDRKLKQNILEMTGLVFAKRETAIAKTAQIKAELEKGNELKEKILWEMGLPKDYLRVKYSCPNCSDTGFVDGVRCECFIRLIGKYTADELNRSANLPDCDFSHFSTKYYKGKTEKGIDIAAVMENNYKAAVKYADDFGLNSDSLLIYGKTGLGKTHISLAIAKRIIEKGFSAVYCSVGNLIDDVSREKYSKNDDLKANIESEIINVDLLVIDDLGAEHTTSYTESILYNIINSRMNLNKPTIINCNLDDFDDLTNRYNDRIVSRIANYYKRMRFIGSDIRQIKRK